MDEGIVSTAEPGFPVITFLLVPDRGAGRRLRRVLAEAGARTGCVVGVWHELLDLAGRAYLAPAADMGWHARLESALEEAKGAFWEESFSGAPQETMAAVADALAEVVAATDPREPAIPAAVPGVPERPRRHLADLARLIEKLGGGLPPELAVLRALLDAAPPEALHFVRVVHIDEHPHLSRWQRALVTKLNEDADVGAGSGDDSDLEECLRRVVAGDRLAAAGNALGHLQRNLFAAPATKVPRDETLQWLGARDVLQEAEVAAGLVQQMLAADPDLEASRIGLLLPDRFEYAVAVEDAFRLGGLLLSGAPADWWKRDLSMEWLFHFLYCRQKPAPAMALAVCLASPLMPWPRAAGSRMAHRVMEGEFSLAPWGVEGRAGHRLLELLREGDRTPQTLSAALKELPGLMSTEERVAVHLQRLAAGVELLSDRLEGADEIDWTGLRRAVTPRVIRSEVSADFNQEGVTVWSEGQEPWRPVKHLVVLGFAQGAYPVGSIDNAVFSGPDLDAIRARAGLSVDAPAEQLARRRARFCRQLGAVSHSATFLVPRRDMLGASTAPSESLVFMAELLEGVEDAQELISELDTAEGRAKARGLAEADPGEGAPPRELVAADIDFGRDLLALRKDAEGNSRPESPSSLETLMVSPLAWLLRRLGAEPATWAPEAPAPALLGSVAHRVMEHLFPARQPIPSEEAIAGSIARQLDEALQAIAPFLRAGQWQVEVRHFREQLKWAALKWREVLVGLDAEILANEAWLEGDWSGIRIHGQTDLILGLPAGRVLVVDYKNSRSGNRQARMQKQFDCQANLYRLMLRTGGLKDASDEALARRLGSAGEIGVVYSLLKDQVALTDTDLPMARGIPSWNFVGDDVSSQGMALTRHRLEEVRRGKLSLNRAGDAEYFDKKAKVTPYALDASPLVRLFTVPGDTEVAT
jgi:ATP-dependent helicase/nuclease subunit B